MAQSVSRALLQNICVSVYTSPNCPFQLKRYMFLTVIINPVGYKGEERQKNMRF